MRVCFLAAPAARGHAGARIESTDDARRWPVIEQLRLRSRQSPGPDRLRPLGDAKSPLRVNVSPRSKGPRGSSRLIAPETAGHDDILVAPIANPSGADDGVSSRGLHAPGSGPVLGLRPVPPGTFPASLMDLMRRLIRGAALEGAIESGFHPPRRRYRRLHRPVLAVPVVM